MHTAPLLSQAASYFAGKQVAVYCSNTGQDYGTSDALRTIHLDFAACRALLDKRDRGPDDIDAANAAATLAHEVGHIRYGSCEFTAESYAMSHWRAFFRRLVGHAPNANAARYVRDIHNSLDPADRRPCP